MEIEQIEAKTYWTRIYLAGDIQAAKDACREYCNKEGICVTVKECDYIYTGGCEAGVEVGLLQYPRFRSSTERIQTCSEELAQRLMKACGQKNALVVNACDTVLHTRRLKGEQ